MNHQKARDFFSAYHEGTLDSGLRMQLETRLRGDATLRADYAAFAEVYGSLNQMSDEDIPIPVSLSDRIATRLEEEEARRRARPGFSRWARDFGLALLGTAAVVSAVFALRGNSEVSQASLAPTPGAIAAPVDTLSFSMHEGKLRVAFQAQGSERVEVSNALTDAAIQTYRLEGQRLELPLANPNPGAALLKITATSDRTPAIVALPGKSRTQAIAGSGSLSDLAAAIAGRYGVPVIVRSTDANAVRWTLAEPNGREAAAAAIADIRHSVDQREDGLITILAN